MAWMAKVLDGSLIFALGVMTVILTLHVFFRYVLNDPILGAEEVALLFAVWMTFLGSAVATRDRAHISIDILVDRLPRSMAGGARIIGGLATVAFSLLLVVEGTKLALFSHVFESSALRFPMSLFYAALPLGAALIACFAGKHTWKQLHELRRGR